MKRVTLMLGGIQGEGIVSAGDILIRALSRAGYYTFGYRNFSSRIKGGHTNYVIDIDRERILSGGDALDLLIAFDQESIILHTEKLRDNGLLIYDDVIVVKDLLEEAKAKHTHILPIPLTEIAKKHGATVMKTAALVGFLGKMFHIPIDIIASTVEATYRKKGSEIISNNLRVAKEAYELSLSTESLAWTNQLPEIKDSIPRASMIGNEAIGLGALLAGCRFMSAYPITPSTEIMEYLIKKLPHYNGVVVQTEDEIAAITMAIGASYAGSRSMTATSGPGLSLKMEGISLAGMIETPVVIVDVQRGGPSTGLPTKHEQSDIQFLYYGPHGEIPSIVVAPYTVEECVYQTIDAFNLADKYQCPVFVLIDLHLGLSRQTMDSIDKNRVTIDRGKIVSNEELSQLQGEYFKRFQFTEDGISPRVFPGQPFGMHHVTGIEHLEIGKPNESPNNRKAMTEKRLKKVEELSQSDSIDLFGNVNSDLLILSLGSNYGIIKRTLEDSHLDIAYGMFRIIKPFPVRQMKELCEKYKKILVIEGNATGQLASIIKKEVGYHDKIHSLLKYDGNPFRMMEIKSKIEELI